MKNRYRFLLALYLIFTDLSIAFLSVYVFLSPSDRLEMWAHWESFQNGLYVSMQAWMLATIYHRLYRNVYINGVDAIYRISWRVFVGQQIFMFLYLRFNPEIYKDVELIQQAILTFTFSSGALLVSRVLITLLARYYEKKMGDKNTVAIWGFNQTGIELAAQFELHANEKMFLGILDEHVVFNYSEKKDIMHQLTEAMHLASLKKIHELYICAAPNALKELKSLFKMADELCLRIRFVPDTAGNYPDNSYIHHVYNFQAISQRSEPLEDQNNRFAKRFFDLFFSLLVIVFVLSWLYPIIGLFIKLQSPGPIIFKQLRSGENNVPFWCYKFRSMRINSDSHLKQATKNDSRIFKFGQFIRKTSLDELPQFFNVLRGDMSMVGPRPHMLNHTKEYNAITENFMVRHFVKPGITGLAQIRGLRGEITDMKYIQERINMDIEYLENWNLIADIKICFLTFYFMVKGDENAF